MTVEVVAVDNLTARRIEVSEYGIPYADTVVLGGGNDLAPGHRREIGRVYDALVRKLEK